MNIASSAVATQMAMQKTAFAQGQIKQTAQNEQQMANILEQAVESGKAAASGGRGQSVDISA